jgi:hypothetical protein
MSYLRNREKTTSNNKISANNSIIENNSPKKSFRFLSLKLQIFLIFISFIILIIPLSQFFQFDNPIQANYIKFVNLFKKKNASHFLFYKGYINRHSLKVI